MLRPTDDFSVVIFARNLEGVRKALPTSIIFTEPAVFRMDVRQHVPN